MARQTPWFKAFTLLPVSALRDDVFPRFSKALQMHAPAWGMPEQYRHSIFVGTYYLFRWVGGCLRLVAVV